MNKADLVVNEMINTIFDSVYDLKQQLINHGFDAKRSGGYVIGKFGQAIYYFYTAYTTNNPDNQESVIFNVDKDAHGVKRTIYKSKFSTGDKIKESILKEGGK